MDSKQTSQICKGLSEWQPFTKKSMRSAPKKHGIYIFRMAQGKRIPRLQGKSDITYIGSTESKNGLKGRLQQYLRPGSRQYHNKRIHELAKKYDMEISWCPCEEARNLELQLFCQYLKNHDELPPLNRTGKRLLKKYFRDQGLGSDIFSRNTNQQTTPSTQKSRRNNQKTSKDNRLTQTYT